MKSWPAIGIALLTFTAVQAQTWTTRTLNFDELRLYDSRGRIAPEQVLPSRYESQGVRIEVGPGYTAKDDKVEAAFDYARFPAPSPGNVFAAIRTNDILSSNDADYPTMVLRFPSTARLVRLTAMGINSTSLEQMDVTMIAYGDDAMTQELGRITYLFGPSPTPYHDGILETNYAGTRAVLLSAIRYYPPNPLIAPIYNEVIIDNLTFETAPYEIKLTRQGSTIEAANGYSENTTVGITIVGPTGSPTAGQTVTTFNGSVTVSEDAGTAYYTGSGGSTLLPATVQVTAGVGQIVLKSLSNSNAMTGPIDAYVSAVGTDLAPNAATIPLKIDQWFDANNDMTVDWLDAFGNAILGCYKAKPGELGTVAKKAIKIQESIDPNSCGYVNVAVVKTSPVFINPVCDPTNVGNEHRANNRNQLSYNVIHESRHAWHMSERAAAAGTNSDGNSATPRNDDDGDLLIEVVSFPSGHSLLESASGSTDATFDPDPAFPAHGFGYLVSESDAQAFGVANKNTCP